MKRRCDMAAAKKKAKPFHTIEIPDVETAANICARLYMNDGEIIRGDRLQDLLYEGISGGEASFEHLKGHTQDTVANIWEDLYFALQTVEADPDQGEPPWLQNVAPNEIEDHSVTYSKDGIEVGCVEVGLERLKAMVKRCEEC
jgi:hypothetical protein